MKAIEKAIAACKVIGCVLPEKIPVDFGIGISFTTNNVEYTTVLPKDGYQVIYGRVTSFRGISFGAIHYYGSFNVYDPTLECIENGKIQRYSIAGAFEKPDNTKGFKIEVVRTLTQKEIDEDPNRWEFYTAGDKTNCWEDEGELLKQMKLILKHRFPNWKYWVEDVYGHPVHTNLKIPD